MATVVYTDLHACSIIHSNTGIPMSYKDIIKIGGTRKVWSAWMCKELGQLTQGYKGKTGTDAMFFLIHQKIQKKFQKIMLLHAGKLWWTTTHKNTIQME